MKKLLSAAFAALISLNLFALHSGDNAEELNRLKFLRGGPVKVLKPSENGAKLRVAIFLLTRAPNLARQLELAEMMQRHYGTKVEFVFITPDPEADARNLMQSRRFDRIPFAVDYTRELTAKYMAGSLLYPCAFVIGDGGKVLWNGEVSDLGEMLTTYFDGTFDAAKAQKCAPLLEELQQLLRESNDRKMQQITEKILAIQPGHPAAMRIRLFALENSGRLQQAFALIHDQRTKAPKVARLYFTELDFIRRYPYFSTGMEELLRSFQKNISASDVKVMMAQMLLNLFPMNLVCLQNAGALLQGISPKEMVRYYECQALFAWRIGKIDEAIKFQKKAVALNARTAGTLKFYEGAKALGDKNR